MLTQAMENKVSVKNHPNPKLNITDKLKAEYVQIAYDNRYIIVKQNTFGTMWVEIVKVADPELAKILIEALVKDIKDMKKQKTVFNNLTKFWSDIVIYDNLLDKDAENDGIK